jgi:hypothetical protein
MNMILNRQGAKAAKKGRFSFTKLGVLGVLAVNLFLLKIPSI